MAWIRIRSLFQVVIPFMVLAIASAQNITMSTASTTAAMTATPITITSSPGTPQTTPEPITLSSVTVTLLVLLSIVGLLGIIFLLFFLLWEVFLRVRKPDAVIDTDGEDRSIRLSTYRLSRGLDFEVSPVEIFGQEEQVGSVKKKDSISIIMDEVPSQDMQDKDVWQVVETKVADDIDCNHHYEDTALSMELENKKRKDSSTPDPLYINGGLPTGRKMSNPTLLQGDNGMDKIQMPSLPQGNIETRAKETKPTKNFDPTDQAVDQDNHTEEYDYVDPSQDRLNDGSGHGDDDDSVQSDYNYPEFPLKPDSDIYATADSDSDDSHDYEQTDRTVVRKPTTNHYKNEKMLNAKGRKAQIE